MKTLTAKNARENMTIVLPRPIVLPHSPDNHYRLVVQDGRKYAIPIGSTPETQFKRLFLDDSDRGRWRIVEEAPAETTKRCESCHWFTQRGIGMGAYCTDCKERGPEGWWRAKLGPEPPLVSTDQNYPPELPIGHVDRPDCVLQGLSGMISEIIGMVEVVLDSSPPIMANWDILHAALIQLNEAQALIGDKASSRIQPEPIPNRWMPMVDEMMDAMDALSKTVNLSPDEGELFDSVTGILLMLKRCPIICAVKENTAFIKRLRADAGLFDATEEFFRKDKTAPEPIPGNRHPDESLDPLFQAYIGVLEALSHE